ncbi:alpha/beta hydrolase [Marinactinospora endophytica]
MYQTLPGPVPLRYARLGPSHASRPPVVLLHGFGSDFESGWVRTGWVRALEEAGGEVVGLDLRGHGGSARPHTPDAYLPEVLAGDVARLLDALGVGRADVVGYSMGARLGWEFAARFPGRARRVVLGGFGPSDPFADVDPASPGSGEAPFDRVFRAAVAAPGADPVALTACVRGQMSRPFSPDPAPVGVRLLLVAGERDALAEGMEALAAPGRGDAVVRIPRRDHLTAVSAQAFKRAVRDFLSAESPSFRTS